MLDSPLNLCLALQEKIFSFGEDVQVIYDKINLSNIKKAMALTRAGLRSEAESQAWHSCKSWFHRFKKN